MTGTAKPSNAADAVSAAQSARFAAAIGRLWPEGWKIGLAVSGGPDSLAMLLLARAAMPGGFEVATVDHGLRPEAKAEAEFVAQTCAALGIAHEVLRVEVAAGNVQEEARLARYAALADWAKDRGLAALATAHHADDQAETVLMRLNRGSGLAGLSGVRARGTAPGGTLPVLRPLLDWRRAELAEIVSAAGIEAVSDPSNADPRYDRVRMRSALAHADWLDVAAVAQSAAYLADANEALDWAFEREWNECVEIASGGVRYEPSAPRAIALRVVQRILAGFGASPRGGEVARLVDALAAGEAGTLGGVVARVEAGGWTFRPEPPRRSG
ncbi:tRNA lysidine(34) synthetase TilS [Altererythrobacter salegens]|uniref:tRNA(Ile)-lysidine synthase n=1 Tax=Croceibacterium salegens TaxID=1737568 RepID=A0A6I4SZR4_9SPHN|nr:tRNA lysidine(34) synthetase TilS [Croceibacterium salegens]MXO60879.1 tRNA lysidine(34) synthetase TilS [Croceibacterium salegens]